MPNNEVSSLVDFEVATRGNLEGCQCPPPRRIFDFFWVPIFNPAPEESLFEADLPDSMDLSLFRVICLTLIIGEKKMLKVNNPVNRVYTRNIKFT